MRRKAWKILSAFSLFCFLAGGIGFWLTYNTPWNPTDNQQILQEQTFDPANVDHLKLTADLANIRLAESPTNDIVVRLIGKLPDAEEPTVSFDEIRQQKDQLEIRITTEKGRSKFPLGPLPFSLEHGNSRFNAVAEIALPKKTFTSLEISTIMGNIEASGISMDQLRLKSELGRIHLEKIQSSGVEVVSSVGEITLSEIMAPLKVTSNIGKVSWKNSSIGHPVQIRSDVGPVELNLGNDPVSLDLEALLGTVDASLPGLSISSSEEGSHIQGEVGSKGPSIKVVTNIGNIQVNPFK